MDDLTPMSFEEAAKYFPEGFEGHGHLQQGFTPAMFYDVRTNPPTCIVCAEMDEALGTHSNGRRIPK